MGNLFSKRKNANTTRRVGHRFNRLLLRNNESYIKDLTEIQEFLDKVDKMLSGELPIPSDFANQQLDIETLKSYIPILDIKAGQLKNVKLLLAKNPDIPNADMLTKLLNEVEPRCSTMSQKLKITHTLTVAGRIADHQNPTDCQPSTSGGSSASPQNASRTNVRVHMTQSTTSSQTIQNGLNRGDLLRRSVRGLSLTAPPTLRPVSSQAQETQAAASTSGSRSHPVSVQERDSYSLIFSQDDPISSSSSNSSDTVSSEEGNQSTTHAKLSAIELKSIEFWRRQNVSYKPKRICVQRSDNVLDTVIPLYANMSSKNLNRVASVKFSGEEGTDMGALTREFFFITFEAVISGTYKGQKVMVGTRGHLIPNAMVDGRLYFYIGQMIVHAVINNSKGICDMSQAIVHYLVSNTSMASFEDSHPPLSVEDVDDCQLRQLLEKYERGEDFVDDEEETWTNWIVESSCSVPWKKAETQSFVVQHLLLYFVFWKRMRQIQSLEEGLKSVGLKQFLVDNPSETNISEVFPSGSEFNYTADAVILKLKTHGSEYDDGIWCFFLQFLKDLYERKIDKFRLPDLVTFVTSSPYFPDKMVVSFKKTIVVPEARACNNEIVLPTVHEDYSSFQEAMVMALRNGLTGFQFQ